MGFGGEGEGFDDAFIADNDISTSVSTTNEWLARWCEIVFQEKQIWYETKKKLYTE